MEQAYRVSHHTGLVRILRGAFAGVGQTNVVTDLMELSTGIVAPLVVVHRQIPIDVGVGDPATVGARGEALHDVVKLALHVAELYIASISNGIADDTILGADDVGIGYIYGGDTVGNFNSTVRGASERQEVEFVVAAGFVLA